MDKLALQCERANCGRGACYKLTSIDQCNAPIHSGDALLDYSIWQPLITRSVGCILDLRMLLCAMIFGLTDLTFDKRPEKPTRKFHSVATKQTNSNSCSAETP